MMMMMVVTTDTLLTHLFRTLSHTFYITPFPPSLPPSLPPIETGCVMMTRTVPVNWCATGGSDTHHKRVVHKDLHEKISEDRKQAERDFRKASVDGRKKRYENIRGVELKCQAVLHR